jgi:DNA polymerase III delta subunit
MSNDENVMVLYGSSKQWIELTARDITLEYRANGYDVREVDAKTDDLTTAFESGLFDTDPIFVVLTNPTKNKKLDQHLKSRGASEVLIVHTNDRLPKALEGYLNRKLDEPQYEDQKKEWASEWVHKYAEKYAKKIDPVLCRAVVNRVGIDLGALRWEVVKYVHAVGEEEQITPNIVVNLISDLTEASFIDLSNAIMERNHKAFIKICEKIERSSKADQTMAVCNGILLSNCINLLEVGLRVEAKMSLDHIAQDLGKNPYAIKNFIAPKIYSFGGVQNLRRLLNVLYECENNVVSGGRDSWLKFKVGVLGIL